MTPAVATSKLHVATPPASTAGNRAVNGAVGGRRVLFDGDTKLPTKKETNKKGEWVK